MTSPLPLPDPSTPVAAGNLLCLPVGYMRRDAEHYFSDLGNKDEWQADVYRLGKMLAPTYVLDIGCGSAFKLVQNFPGASAVHAVGTDVAQTVKELRNRYPWGDWRVSDFAERWGEKFDLVILADVLEHLLNPCDALAFAAAHLAPHGAIIVSSPAREYLLHAYCRPMGPPRNGAHVQEWAHAELVELVGRYADVQFAAVSPPHTTVILCRARH